MYKLGDKGLVVEFINSRLGVRSNVFTEETKTRLKQFQAAYRQYLKDDTEKQFYEYWQTITNVNNDTNLNFTYDPYNQIYYELNNPSVQNINSSNPNEPEYEIYPNGICDEWTLQALTEIDIETYDNRILEQVQSTLSMTDYTKTNMDDETELRHPIEPTGVYDDVTHTAIRNFQIAYNIGQEKIPIYEHKNLLSNIKEEWGNFTYYYTSEVDEYLYSSSQTYKYSKVNILESSKLPQYNDYTILSPFIKIDSGYTYYLSIQNSTDYYIKLMFFKYDNSDTGNRILQLSNNLHYEVSDTETGFNQWLDTSVDESAITPGEISYDGIIYPNYYSPYDPIMQVKTNINYGVRYLRVMIRHKPDEHNNPVEITPDVLDDLHIQLEKGSERTEFEPYSQTVSNSFQSGYINIPTYNKIKEVFNLREADF